MTVADLKLLIGEVVDERLQNRQQHSQTNRSVEDVLVAMDRLRWTPPSGSPTTTELLREERDR